MSFCTECGKELINPNAEICPNCGERLKSPPLVIPEKNPVISVILSIIITGLGQLYNGQAGKALVYFIIGIINVLLVFVLIGIVTAPIWWILNILDAYFTAKRINEGKDASGFLNLS
jgi:TM2 domain-containing membrane protein YozV